VGEVAVEVLFEDGFQDGRTDERVLGVDVPNDSPNLLFQQVAALSWANINLLFSS